MVPLFANDEYVTPGNTSRFWLDRLFPEQGFYFYARFILEIVRARWEVSRGLYDRVGWAQSSRRVMTLIERCNGRFHITGLDYLRHYAGPVVFASNHMSALENNVMPCLIVPFMPMTYVIKASLLKYPIFGPLLASRDPIPVGRANPREDLQTVLTEGCERLAQGISVILYPQSTRTTAFDPATFNSLGVKLARRAGVPVIPVAVKTDFWQNGKLLRDFGRIDRRQTIHIAFGPPISVENSGKSAHRQIVAFIASHLQRWGVPSGNRP